MIARIGFHPALIVGRPLAQRLLADLGDADDMAEEVHDQFRSRQRRQIACATAVGFNSPTRFATSSDGPPLDSLLKQHVGLEAEHERVAYGGYATGLDEILNLGLHLNATPD